MSVTIDATFVPKLAKKARLKLDRHANKYMIIYPERGLELNDTAAAIAQKLDGTRSIGTIAGELAKEHDAAHQDIEKDVLAFVCELRDKGLLELG